jgi:hypothetical protein
MRGVWHSKREATQPVPRLSENPKIVGTSAVNLCEAFALLSALSGYPVHF